MRVTRLSKGALTNLLEGKTSVPTTCVVKFYSNGCHYCHKLKEYYETIAEEHSDLHFFAFNIQDATGIENELGFKGVPTIIKVNTNSGPPQIEIIDEPHTPNEYTYYTSTDIKNFINGEHQK